MLKVTLFSERGSAFFNDTYRGCDSYVHFRDSSLRAALASTTMRRKAHATFDKKSLRFHGGFCKFASNLGLKHDGESSLQSTQEDPRSTRKNWALERYKKLIRTRRKQSPQQPYQCY